MIAKTLNGKQMIMQLLMYKEGLYNNFIDLKDHEKEELEHLFLKSADRLMTEITGRKEWEE